VFGGDLCSSFRRARAYFDELSEEEVFSSFFGVVLEAFSPEEAESPFRPLLPELL
jgi:hypothetical protein